MSRRDELEARESQLRAELAEHQEFLEAPADEPTFASSLTRQQMELRVEHLRNELRAVQERHFTFRLAHHAGSGKNAIETRLLGFLLTKLHTALTYTGWALRAGAGIEGPPPLSISRATATEVVALSPGSFEVTVRKSKPELPVEEGETDLLEPALDVMLELARAASEESFDSSALEVAESLGGESSRRLSQWFAKVAEESMTTDLSWSVAPEKRVVLEPRDARMLSEWLRSVEERTTEDELEGVLRTADAIKKRFAIESADGETYEGKADPELLHGAEIDARYKARVRVVVSEAEHTTSTTEKLTLLSLDRVG